MSINNIVSFVSLNMFVERILSNTYWYFTERFSFFSCILFNHSGKSHFKLLKSKIGHIPSI